MREIKFRIWDIDKRKFVVNKIDRLSCGDTKKCMSERVDFENNSVEINADERYIFSEYTGLEDKNNKEIYEGDIVKFKDCSIDGTKEFYNIGVIEREGKRDELVISQLIFEKSYFTENYMDFINQTFELSEIIGNIYENPELIKEVR